jgi:hypothetical protein
MNKVVFSIFVLTTCLIQANHRLILEQENFVLEKAIIENDTLMEKTVFVGVSEDSDVVPANKIWREELESFGFGFVESKDQAKWIFKFRLKKALGDCHVEVTVYDAMNNKELWKSKRYRGTINIQNDISPPINGIRKCFDKGIVPALEGEKF